MQIQTSELNLLSFHEFQTRPMMLSRFLSLFRETIAWWDVVVYGHGKPLISFLPTNSEKHRIATR